MSQLLMLQGIQLTISIRNMSNDDYIINQKCANNIHRYYQD